MNALRRWLGHPLPAVIFLLIYIVSQTLIARTLQAGNAEALLFQFQFRPQPAPPVGNGILLRPKRCVHLLFPLVQLLSRLTHSLFKRNATLL